MGRGGVAVRPPDPPRTAPAGRSWLVRLLLRFVHRHDRSGRHPAVRWLLARAGRDPARSGLAVDCRQCGDPSSVSLLRLSPRRARYWCRRCGAVVTLTTRSEVRQVRARPGPPVPAAAPGLDRTDARQVLPTAMLRWVESWSRRPVTLEALDKSTMYQLYQRWDAHLARLSPPALAGLAVEGEPPPLAGLPPFSAVVGALHDACYHSELAVRALRRRGLDTGCGPAAEPERPAPERAARERAVYQRAEHARRWLAGRAGELCWIVSRLPHGQLAVPDPGAVRAAVAALRSGGQPDPVAGRAARAALFGTDGGPALPTLQAVYPATELAVALAAYLESGARPLRDDVLARLTAPPAGPA